MRIKRIYLVRHAQSEFNEKGLFQGRLDSDLTPLGFVQARMVANFLKGKNIQAILSSPQRRAYKTALTISDVLDLPVEIDERLREMSFGNLEGKRFLDLASQERDLIKAWLENPVKSPLPTQESMILFEERVRSFLEDITAREEETVVVVAHGGTLHALVCLAIGISLEKMWWVHMDNTGVSLLEHDGGSFRLRFLNKLCHLNH